MVEIRVARESDYPAISRIQLASPEAAQWPVGDYSNFEILLALVEGKPAGFCAWRQTVPDEAELVNLAVTPEFRRRGLGEGLLLRLIEVASGDIFLEVAAPNIGAIRLYTKLGWQAVGVRQGYYEQGRTDGIVMKRNQFRVDRIVPARM